MACDSAGVDTTLEVPDAAARPPARDGLQVLVTATGFVSEARAGTWRIISDRYAGVPAAQMPDRVLAARGGYVLVGDSPDVDLQAHGSFDGGCGLPWLMHGPAWQCPDTTTARTA